MHRYQLACTTRTPRDRGTTTNVTRLPNSRLLKTATMKAYQNQHRYYESNVLAYDSVASFADGFEQLFVAIPSEYTTKNLHIDISPFAGICDPLVFACPTPASPMFSDSDFENSCTRSPAPPDSMQSRLEPSTQPEKICAVHESQSHAIKFSTATADCTCTRVVPPIASSFGPTTNAPFTATSAYANSDEISRNVNCAPLIRSSKSAGKTTSATKVKVSNVNSIKSLASPHSWISQADSAYASAIGTAAHESHTSHEYGSYICDPLSRTNLASQGGETLSSPMATTGIIDWVEVEYPPPPNKRVHTTNTAPIPRRKNDGNDAKRAHPLRILPPTVPTSWPSFDPLHPELPPLPPKLFTVNATKEHETSLGRVNNLRRRLRGEEAKRLAREHSARSRERRKEHRQSLEGHVTAKIEKCKRMAEKVAAIEEEAKNLRQGIVSVAWEKYEKAREDPSFMVTALTAMAQVHAIGTYQCPVSSAREKLQETRYAAIRPK
eukprot:comp19932_c0_seq1/m.24216 comp19932_c0_seq1/g.24216  ORF comp19932_c0_seq1/g.24216 comp19932_c0_seq1/m.24216 type:complete len:494 (-) comp19932_c0_seq1:819-2300(-)